MTRRVMWLTLQSTVLKSTTANNAACLARLVVEEMELPSDDDGIVDVHPGLATYAHQAPQTKLLHRD
jgi:hypothetical protein